MTLKEIKQKYNVDKYNGQYLIFDPKEGSCDRFVHKYLCSLTRVSKTSFKITGTDIVISKMDSLDEQIKSFTSSLKYDSHYYNPMYKNGTFEELVIHDYLSEIGFKNDYGNLYVLSHDNVYEEEIRDASIGITFEKEKVRLILHTGDFSFVNINCSRDIEEIKNGINSLVKPLLVSEGIKNLNASEKLGEIEKMTEMNLNVITRSMDVVSTEYKAILKEKLTQLIETM